MIKATALITVLCVAMYIIMGMIQRIRPGLLLEKRFENVVILYALLLVIDFVMVIVTSIILIMRYL